jgi:hypothetical protein
MKNNLSTLSILHYVYGGLVCFIGAAIFVLLLTLGNIFQSDWFLENTHDAPPAAVGAVLSIVGWAVFFFLEAKGIANIISGNLLAKARGRLFSQIVAGVDCLNIPFGITLGIFTFVELNKEDVKQAYAAQGAGM